MSTGRPTIRYYVTVKGNEHVVDLTETPEGGYAVLFDEEAVDADLVSLHGQGLYSLLMDGHSREMVLEREGDRTFVSLDGERIDVRVQDEVSRALSAIGGVRTAGPSEIAAPMPGIVVDVLVASGDSVVAGQAVVVLEAMKMQNELVAEADGIVDRILAEKGETVDGGATLVTLLPPAPEDTDGSGS
jgi:biotin carboxyl carrier protein